MKVKTVEKNLLSELLSGFEEEMDENLLYHLQNDPRYKFFWKEYERIQSNCCGFKGKENEELHSWNDGAKGNNNWENQECYLQGLNDGMVLASLLKEARQLILEYLREAE